MENKLPSISILGVNITTATKDKVLEFILEKASKRDEKVFIVTPNPEIIIYALEHENFQKVLNRAQISIPDGVGVVLSGKILNKQPLKRITGVDMMEIICREASKRALTVGFLGGRGDVAERTALCLSEKYPNLIVSYANSEWNEDLIKFNMFDNQIPHEDIVKNTDLEKVKKHIDILFVAFGFPKQEIWINDNLSKIPVTVAMGVGGAFDYLSGDVKRAPQFIRNVGMEWVYRLSVQPWRFKRQLALPKFAYKVLREKLRTS